MSAASSRLIPPVFPDKSLDPFRGHSLGAWLRRQPSGRVSEPTRCEEIDPFLDSCA